MLFRSHGPHATPASDFYFTLKASYAGLFFRLNVSFIINK
ncbi:Asparaginyl-tRNA synthetase [Salmonella enterica subsp. enterica serovar Cubana]|nr:Asparaginyl-tRNA synthetase [Salmonella enterica subsp. enterica serovar Cubana]